MKTNLMLVLVVLVGVGALTVFLEYSHYSNDTPLGVIDGQVEKVAIQKKPENPAAQGLERIDKKSDPNIHAALVTERAIAFAIRLSTDNTYRVLFDHLDLNDEDRNALINLITIRSVVVAEGLSANGIRQWSHDVTFVINGKQISTSVYTGDGAFLDQFMSDLSAPVDNQIQGLLGDDKFSIYQNFMDTCPYRVLADTLSLKANNINEPEFTQEQKEIFISAMVSNNALKSNYLDTEIPNSVVNTMASIVTPAQLKIIADMSKTKAELNRLSLLEAKKYQAAAK